MIRAGAIIFAALLGAPGVATATDGDAARRDCVAAAVPLTDAAYVRLSPGVHRLEVTVTNGLDWPISGIRIDWALTDADGTVLGADRTGSFIPEAIAPGAARAFSFYAPEVLGAAAATLTARTVDVGDADGNQFVNDVRLMGGGWTNLTSPLECAS